MEKTGIIYAHKNKINGKVYVGQTVQKLSNRWGKYGQKYKKCTKFWRAIQKYGWNNFEHIILEENLPIEQLNEKEKYWIEYYNSIDNGYNIRIGGNNSQLTDDHKEKIRQSHIESTGKKIICLNNKKIYNSINEARRETGALHIGDCCNKKILSSGKDINGNALIWRFIEDYNENEEIQIPVQKRSKTKVICVETEQIYNSAKEAERQTGIDSSSIGRVCNGKRKTAGGFHWNWIE